MPYDSLMSSSELSVSDYSELLSSEPSRKVREGGREDVLTDPQDHVYHCIILLELSSLTCTLSTTSLCSLLTPFFFPSSLLPSLLSSLLPSLPSSLFLPCFQDFQQELYQLKDEFERYKMRAQSVLRSKGNKARKDVHLTSTPSPRLHSQPSLRPVFDCLQ